MKALDDNAVRHLYRAQRIKTVRKKLGVYQSMFAEKLGVYPNIKDGFQPLPRTLTDRLAEYARSGEALCLYQNMLKRCDSTAEYPDNPLIHVPSHTARALNKYLKKAGIPKQTPEGKLDFHAIRVAFVNFVLDSRATVKEAQTLSRHSSPDLTMNVYGRTRNNRYQRS